MRVAALFVSSMLILPVVLLAQSEGTAYVEPPEGEEIQLARSAAPDEVSADATIWVLRGGKYQIAVNGTNGNHCVVQRSLPKSLEPICYDAEASRTVLEWEFEHFALRIAGMTGAEIDTALDAAIAEGRMQAPQRPAMTYMLSSGQRLYDAESGKSAGNWRPHLMYYIPGLTSEQIGLHGPSGMLYVENAGTSRACLIIVVPQFVDPKPAPAKR